MRHTTINRVRPALRLSLALALLMAAATAQAAYTTGNLLVDPSFENRPLFPYAQILGSPNATGVWGAEQAVISPGPIDGITPAHANFMLRMSDDGGLTTQAFQLVDVTAYTTDINAGIVTVDASGYLNVPHEVAAAVSSVSVSFWDGSYNSLGFVGTGSNVLPGGFMDTNPATWQQLSVVGASVPVGTQYLLMQFAYNNASMIDTQGMSRAGYVDATELTLTAVPEPSTLALGGMAFLGAMWLRKRAKKRAA